MFSTNFEVYYILRVLTCPNTNYNDASTVGNFLQLAVVVVMVNYKTNNRWTVIGAAAATNAVVTVHWSSVYLGKEKMRNQKQQTNGGGTVIHDDDNNNNTATATTKSNQLGTPTSFGTEWGWNGVNCKTVAWNRVTYLIWTITYFYSSYIVFAFSTIYFLQISFDEFHLD